MIERDPERRLEDLLASALAPPQRPPDAAFVARVEANIAELERYRLWRAKMARRFTTQLFATGAVGGALALISQAPETAMAVSQQPTFISAGVAVMLLCWLGLTGLRPKLLA